MTPDAPHSAYLEAVGRDLEIAARRQAYVLRRRRTRMRVAALSVTAAILVTGTSLAGSSLLGTPAPGFVQASIDSLWPGGDRDGLAPIEGSASVVARFDGDALYRSPARAKGDVCLSIVPEDPEGPVEGGSTTCVKRISHSKWPLGVLSMIVGDRQLVFGQIRDPAGMALVLRLPGADPIQIPIGEDGYFLGEMPLSDAGPGTEQALGMLRVEDGEGFVITSHEVTRLTG